MQTWDTYKQAALEYSKMRPRRRSASLAPTAGQKNQTLPEDCLSVQYVAWGDESTFIEVVTASDDNTTQGWVVEDGQLWLTPAPTDTTPIQVVYCARHLPNETNQTFPTIAVSDQHYVDDLEQAIILELEADDVARGPSIYTIGQTQVSRAEALADLRDRAQQLRARVAQALEEPLAYWR